MTPRSRTRLVVVAVGALFTSACSAGSSPSQPAATTPPTTAPATAPTSAAATQANKDGRGDPKSGDDKILRNPAT